MAGQEIDSRSVATALLCNAVDLQQRRNCGADEPFETGRVFTPRADRHSQITVRTNRYSVPVRLIGKRVRVVLHASHLVVYDRHGKAARHERLIAKAGCRLEPDHYLEALIREPGAFVGATALEQAGSAGKFEPGPQGPR
ncbi:Mu transposase domain-containing protein [Streptomyces olivaceoviridis]